MTTEETPIRVLIADDHAILRDGIRSILNEEGQIKLIGEAEDGQQAVAMVEETEPDIVLMDISMPNLNGIEATRLIKEQHPEIKVLVLSMHDNEEYIVPLLKAGASGYVLKQTATRELISAIHAVHQGHTILNPGLADSVLRGGQDFAPAQESEPDGETGEDYDGLTDREIEVLTLVAEGLTNRQIADRLYISIKTVQAHRSNMMEKLDLHDRVALTKYALRKKLITLDDND